MWLRNVMSEVVLYKIQKSENIHIYNLLDFTETLIHI